MSMLNFKRFILMTLIGAVIVSCQDEEVADLNQQEMVNVEAIASDDLPSESIAYIEDNFSGEVVVSAYRVTASDVTYEAFLTNDVNLVFSEDGSLAGYGEEGSVVDCGGRPGRGVGRRGPGRPGGNRPDSTDRPTRTEITVDDLPTAASDYLTTNYPDSTINAVLLIEHDDSSEYHVLIENVGAVIFDADGNFVEVKEPRGGSCGSFTEVEIADLPTAITDYVAANYPDNEILRARTGTRDDVVEIHLVVDSVGVLIFDESGTFIELKTCGMDGE